ncbi:MAG: RecX family transcriptional regulator [Chitinophagaceae bacterium]|nr:RecX family transcriptional regulator [Chitinophagaceae bacterium]MCB9044814.1 RecX family transcriptional regulator [Chitinophagales bacterium]
MTHYCRYQERSHKEVKNKLYELGCTTDEVEEYIIKVIEAGFLNEERYARAVARGKFRMKQWGRNKIVQQLKQQQVSEYCIKKALTEIDEHEYLATIKKLAEKKLNEIRSEKNIFIRKQKIYRYLAQKGYESSLINEAVNEILKH